MLEILIRNDKELKYQFKRGISLNDIKLLKQELKTWENYTDELKVFYGYRGWAFSFPDKSMTSGYNINCYFKEIKE